MTGNGGAPEVVVPVTVAPYFETVPTATTWVSVLCPPSGPPPRPSTTTAYTWRPPLSTRWITVRWLALLGRGWRPRFRLSPGLRACTGLVGQAPSVLRSPASAAYRATADSRKARA